VEFEGSPASASPTVPVKPFIGVIVTVYVALEPAAIPESMGVIAMLKSFVAACVTSVMLAVCDFVPLVPVNMIVNPPTGVEVEVVTVTVAVPEFTMEVGLIAIVVPAGAPVAPRPMVPAKPFSAVAVRV
jgi:hypothetical protein